MPLSAHLFERFFCLRHTASSGYSKEDSEDGEAKRVGTSVTRVGDFNYFGRLFKAFCNNQFAQISNEIIFGQFYRHLAIFIWSHWLGQTNRLDKLNFNTIFVGLSISNNLGSNASFKHL